MHAVGVVTSCDQQGSGGVGADSDGGQQRRVLAWAQRRVIWVVSSLISAVRVWYLRARERNACLAYLMVVLAVLGRNPAQVLTRALAGSLSSWCLTWWGAVTTRACNWLMAWVRALVSLYTCLCEVGFLLLWLV